MVSAVQAPTAAGTRCRPLIGILVAAFRAGQRIALLCTQEMVLAGRGRVRERRGRFGSVPRTFWCRSAARPRCTPFPGFRPIASGTGCLRPLLAIPRDGLCEHSVVDSDDELRFGGGTVRGIEGGHRRDATGRRWQVAFKGSVARAVHRGPVNRLGRPDARDIVGDPQDSAGSADELFQPASRPSLLT